MHAMIALVLAGATAPTTPPPLVAEPGPFDWPQFGGGPARAGVLDPAPVLPQGSPPLAPASLDAPTWVIPPSVAACVGQSGVVRAGRAGFALASVAGSPRLVRFDARTGAIEWAAPVPAPFLNSWSTPAVDASIVVVAAGSGLHAFDAASGSPCWVTPLDRPVVNASPLIVADRAGRVRVFVADYDPFAGEGSLVCVNASAFDDRRNPFQPGERLWTAPIGAASGNTPAYADGWVLVASVGDALGHGQVFAFPAHHTPPAAGSPPPSPLWTYTRALDEGFFSGVSVRDERAYAATYSFFGGHLNSSLVCLDARDGSLEWIAPCARTSSTPVPLDDSRVLLSGGIDAFGTVPTLQLFDSGGSLLWDAAIDTWIDADHDLVLDPGEFLRVGGWTHLPGVAIGAAGPLAFAGAIPTGPAFNSACTDLYTLDLSRSPGDPLFVIDHADGAGSTPALAPEGVLTIGTSGLVAFGRFASADVNLDGRVDIEDLHAWEQGAGERDVDGDGSVAPRDRAFLLDALARPDEDQPR